MWAAGAWRYHLPHVAVAQLQVAQGLHLLDGAREDRDLARGTRFAKVSPDAVCAQKTLYCTGSALVSVRNAHWTPRLSAVYQ